MEFEKDGFTHYIKRIPHECRERYYKRGGFIGELYTKWDGDYDRLVQLSKIWSSIKFDGTRYHNSIEKTIMELTRDSDYEISSLLKTL